MERHYLAHQFCCGLNVLIDFFFYYSHLQTIQGSCHTLSLLDLPLSQGFVFFAHRGTLHTAFHWRQSSEWKLLPKLYGAQKISSMDRNFIGFFSCLEDQYKFWKGKSFHRLFMVYNR